MLLDKPNNWTDDQYADFLNKLNQCIKKKEAHWDSYYSYSRYDTLTNLPTIMISSLLSTLSVSHLANSEEGNDNSNIYNYIIVAGSLSITVLTTISKFFNFGELKEKHKNFGINYEKLRSDLIQIIEEKDDYHNSINTYSDLIKIYYNKINFFRENEPILSKSKKDKYQIINLSTDDSVVTINGSPAVSIATSMEVNPLQSSDV